MWYIAKKHYIPHQNKGFHQMSSCGKDLTAKDYVKVFKHFGLINPGVKCPKCMSCTYINLASQKWCTSCEWSNDPTLSKVLKRISK